MKTLKINLGILIVCLVAISTLAFKPATTQLYWFEVAANGTIGNFESTAGPAEGCESDSALQPYCSVAFEESEIGSPMAPTAPIATVQDDPSRLVIDELKYQNEP